MKKLIASLLFFGSFSVAMADSSISPTSLWQGFSSIFRHAAPVMPVVIPNTTKAVAAITNAVKAVGDQRYCRNEPPVSVDYCNHGKADYLGGDGTRCSQLPGCIGTTDNPMNQCRPAPQCVSNEPLLLVSVSSSGVSCTPSKPLPNPCTKEMISGELREDYIQNCIYYRAPQTFGTAMATFTATMKGGNPAYQGTTQTLRLPLISPNQSVIGTFTVTDSSKPAKFFPVSVRISCPIQRPQKSRCDGFNNNQAEDRGERECKANDCVWGHPGSIYRNGDEVCMDIQPRIL